MRTLRSELEDALEEQVRRIDWLGVRMDALEERERSHVRVIEQTKRLIEIETLRRWLAHVALRTNPLVSVVLPTRDRAELLARAIGSVIAQRYSNWELLVVDDGGSADSQGVAESFADPRVRWWRIPHRGAAAARNDALRRASGEIIAYLDDDNLLDRDWLYAVVWAFEQRPDVDTLYGAFVIDDFLRVDKSGAGALPQTFLHPFDREALKLANLADMSAIAHRAGLPNAWFDESLIELCDWDLLVRLTAEKDPLVLPAIACLYTTDSPSRLTRSRAHEAEKAIIAARAAERLKR